MRGAESSLLQWFLRIGEVARVKAPGKSTLERFSQWVGAATRAAGHQQLVTQAVTPASATAPQPLNLTEVVDATGVFFDSTCLKANIHFPVGWLLLRDAARPLRQRKALEKMIARHAQSQRDLLEPPGAETALSKKQAEAIWRRSDHVLTQLPAALTQAHARLIGGRPGPNANKILRLYEPEVEVLTRGKAGADAEFGNKLWLGETRAGLIGDWARLGDAPADTAQALPAVERRQGPMKLTLQQVWGDRGLSSQAKEKQLAARAIKSGLCPRDPAGLQKRLHEDAGFRAAGAARRRASRSSSTASPAVPAGRKASRRANGRSAGRCSRTTCGCSRGSSSRKTGGRPKRQKQKRPETRLALIRIRQTSRRTRRSGTAL